VAIATYFLTFSPYCYTDNVYIWVVEVVIDWTEVIICFIYGIFLAAIAIAGAGIFWTEVIGVCIFVVVIYSVFRVFESMY